MKVRVDAHSWMYDTRQPFAACSPATMDNLSVIFFAFNPHHRVQRMGGLVMATHNMQVMPYAT